LKFCTPAQPWSKPMSSMSRNESRIISTTGNSTTSAMRTIAGPIHGSGRARRPIQCSIRPATPADPDRGDRPGRPGGATDFSRRSGAATDGSMGF
jgi:hypothetical protein